MTLGFVGMLVGLLGLIGFGLWLGRRKAKPEPHPTGPIIVVDGSNVMHWGEGRPSLKVLGLVLEALQRRGFVPLVLFDANVGYKLADRHMSAWQLAAGLPILERQIGIVPSGTPADPYVIEEAIAQGARVVSNDRFMDWRATYPALRGKRFLVKGRVTGARVELRL